jgi:hypothetical protein
MIAHLPKICQFSRVLFLRLPLGLACLSSAFSNLQWGHGIDYRIRESGPRRMFGAARLRYRSADDLALGIPPQCAIFPSTVRLLMRHAARRNGRSRRISNIIAGE